MLGIFCEDVFDRRAVVEAAIVGFFVSIREPDVQEQSEHQDRQGVCDDAADSKA